MKKVLFSAAALMLASAFSFAGTPETKEAKPEVKTEVKTEAALVYHYVSKNSNGSINFALGEPTSPSACQGSQQIPCRWTSDEELSSPMQPADIESEATVTARRPNN